MKNSEAFSRHINNRIYYSQAGQDLFVVEMLKRKKNGYYCEVGGNHPFDSNNTYLLESEYGWKGMSIEYDKELVIKYNAQRENSCIHSDATDFDYLDFFKSNLYPKQIDYLSLDIDPAENTYKALLQIPFDEYRFSVITYEHDRYSSGPNFMNKSRDFLNSKGYKMVIGNVKIFGRDFEDWYVDESIVGRECWGFYENVNLEFSEIFNSKF